MTLILLAGGKSTRLGIEKAFLELEGRLLIEQIICKLMDLFDDVLIISSGNIDKLNKIANKISVKYRLKGKRRIVVKQDLIKNKGPLGGIYSGLFYSKTKNNFVIACDMPFVNHNLISFMWRLANRYNFHIIVPKISNFIEPLHAVYSKDVLKKIKKQIESGNLKIFDFINKIEKTKVRYITKEEIERFDKNRLCFFNLNNISDLKKAKSSLSAGKI